MTKLVRLYIYAVCFDLKHIYKGSQNVLLYTWGDIVLSVSDNVPRYRALKLSVIYSVAGGSCGLMKTSDMAQCGSFKSRTELRHIQINPQKGACSYFAKWLRVDDASSMREHIS